jgi:FtsP/CotA-like multicopper oxidase with cupredoxin domain
VTANGVERMFMSINRQLPGPAIQVCKNDLIVVDVVNEMEGSDTTIHWHGIDHSDTPFMDGVPYVTQCPIHFGSMFRYKFEANSEGTFFYHSHAGHQKSNGVYGALVVRDYEREELFDKDLPEHVVVLSDWMNSLTEDFFPGLKSEKSHPHSLLINGRGRNFEGAFNASDQPPLTIFHIDQGQKFKFRIIGASSGVCPIKFQIESHNFTVIATDAIRVKPFRADTLVVTSGERYDIVVHANQHEKETYWMRISLIDQCVDDDIQIEQFAVLLYHRTDDQIRARPVMMKIESESPDEQIFLSTVVSSCREIRKQRLVIY